MPSPTHCDRSTDIVREDGLTGVATDRCRKNRVPGALDGVMDVVGVVEGVDEGFDGFFAAAEPSLRRALVARYGLDRGREATAEALAWGFEHWDRLRAMENPTGYLYRVGCTKARGRRRRVPFEAPPAPGEPEVEPELAAALTRLSANQRVRGRPGEGLRLGAARGRGADRVVHLDGEHARPAGPSQAPHRAGSRAMNDDELSDHLRRLVERAQPVDLDEIIHRRPVRGGRTVRGVRLLVVALAGVAVLALVAGAVALLRIDRDDAARRSRPTHRRRPSPPWVLFRSGTTRRVCTAATSWSRPR